MNPEKPLKRPRISHEIGIQAGSSAESQSIIQPIELPNVMRPPPNLPTALGSCLYPSESFDPNTRTPLSTQMREISVARQSNEYRNIQAAKGEDHHEFNKANRHIKFYCGTCSEFVGDGRDQMQVVAHKHFSSMSYRLWTRSDQWGQFLCHSCEKTPHYYKSGIRYPILITSSTLANWQRTKSEMGYPGDKIHMDYIAIPGATIKDLELAFRAEYELQFRPVDVLLVAGLNDVIRGHPIEEIINDIIKFKKLVLCKKDSTQTATMAAMASN